MTLPEGSRRRRHDDVTTHAGQLRQSQASEATCIYVSHASACVKFCTFTINFEIGPNVSLLFVIGKGKQAVDEGARVNFASMVDVAMLATLKSEPHATCMCVSYSVK